MNIEIKVKIKTEKLDVELSQEEAKELYDQLKDFFGEKDTTYIPYYPTPVEPYKPIYIGDVPPYTDHWTTGQPSPRTILSSDGEING